MTKDDGQQLPYHVMHENVRKDLEKDATALVTRAMRLGFVIHIYQESVPPLAMGRYSTKIDVRSER
jgi:hypothetical protein